MSLNRRRFLVASALAAAGTPLLAQTAPKRGPRLDLEIVREFVGAAHGDLEKTRSMLDAQARIVNATHDWGDGDFETALGGAAHMGRADIATLLLERGARLDIFAAAMLGRLDVVRAAVAAFPGIADVPGPHGIPLIRHAHAGGERSAEVVRFLEGSKGRS